MMSLSQFLMVFAPRAVKLTFMLVLALILPFGASASQNPWQDQEGHETTDDQPDNKKDEKGQESSDEPQETEDDAGEENEERSWRDHLYWADGLYLDSTWNNLRIKFAGDIQNDTAGFLNTDSAEEAIGVPIEDGVEWRRARIDADGTFGTHFHFRFRWDFTAANPPNLQDAYFGLRELPIPTLQIIGGRFRAPLGLEGYTSADNTTFMERSLTSAFLPSRNTGLLFYGSLPRKRMRWAVGVLQPESEDFNLKNTDNIGLSGRFAGAFHPGGGKTLVHLGLDLWRRNVEPTIEFASQPESNLAPNFVNTGEFPSSHVNIAVLESAVQKGRLSFQGEFVPATVETDSQGDFFFYAFYVMGSYFLTGETRPYLAGEGRFGRPHPKHELRDGAGGRGAFEVAFRFSRIVLTDKIVTGGELNDLTAAFNWYPTYSSRVAFNVIRANLKGADPVWVFQGRLQISF
jgi:phosphate-selective porin OprO/OprP